MVEYKRIKDFEVGIIGVGGIGSTVAHYLLYTYPGARLNLNSRDHSRLKVKINEIIANRGNCYNLFTEIEARDRIRTFENIDGKITEGDIKKRFLDSDFIIVSARNSAIPFSSFREREDEYYANKKVIKEIAERLEGYKGIVLVVTNPLELSCEEIANKSKIPKNRIVGVSYVDTLRFRRELAREINKVGEYKVTEQELNKAVVIGEHGPTMVPIYHLLKIKGKRFVDNTKLNTESLRKRIKQALVKDPTKLQTGEDGSKNVRIPSISVIHTLDSLITGEVLPMQAYDGDCFITNLARAIKVEQPDGVINIIERDKEFLDRISKIEKRKYRQSKEEILRKLEEAGLS